MVRKTVPLLNSLKIFLALSDSNKSLKNTGNIKLVFGRITYRLLAGKIVCVTSSESFLYSTPSSAKGSFASRR